MRKGWDNLSDAYRRRLELNGINKSAYDSGTTLAGARGHLTSNKEAFYRRSASFARDVSRNDSSLSSSQLRQRIRSMGMVRGTEYMDKRRAMVRAFESGNIDRAHALWEQRDTSLPDYLYHYHGVFNY